MRKDELGGKENLVNMKERCECGWDTESKGDHCRRWGTRGRSLWSKSMFCVVIVGNYFLYWALSILHLEKN